MEEVRLNLAERSYSILVGPDLIGNTGLMLRERGLKGRVLVVTNPTVAKWYLQPLTDSLVAAGYSVETAEIPDGEEYKSLEQAENLYNRLVDGKYDRKSLLIALGGGVIGDLTGFVAATYMRGIDFVQIPTTLLAQVDSSVGGKVAVNHPQGKNLIGSFYQPKLVISDVMTLRTLPRREFSSGMAEVIKHGLILDENYFQLICGELGAIRQLEPGIMTWIIAGSCKIKAQVVEKDEKETGRRAVLNFGHTLGHALESVTHFQQFKHGEAIAVGMLAAIRISQKLNLLEQADLWKLTADLFQSLDLPTQIPGLKVEPIFQALQLDKKVEAGKVHWVLPQKVGAVTMACDLPLKLVEEIILEMGAL